MRSQNFAVRKFIANPITWQNFLVNTQVCIANER